MIRRSTWIVVALLLLLVGFSFYLRDRQARQLAAATPTKGAAPLFGTDQGTPGMIRVESAVGVVVQFSRHQNGTWVLDAPANAAADQAAAEAAATQIGALRVLSRVELPAEIIGLDNPQYTVTVAFGGGPPHNLLVGSITPIQDGYYVQLDGGPSQVVDKFGLEQLIGLLTSPPYAATPTPRPSVTPEASLATPANIAAESASPGISAGTPSVTAMP